VADYLTKHGAAIRKALALALFLSIAPFLLLTLFAQPAYDDYCFSAQAGELGFAGSLKYFYNGWDGKYFYSVLRYLNPLTFGSFAGYKAVALLVILLTFTSIFCFVSALLERSVSTLDKLLAALFLAALYSNQMPDLTEGYYWAGSTLTYQVGAALSLFFFALAAKLRGRTEGARLLLAVLCCVTVALVVGISETVMVIFDLLLLLITAQAFRERWGTRWAWLSFLIAALVCSAVVLAAPGNAVRASNFPDKHRLFYSVSMSLLQEARFLFTWLSNSSFALGTVFFIPVAFKLAGRVALLKRLYVHPLASTLLLLTVVFLGFFLPYWGTGLLGQHRTANLVYLYFLVGWFVNILIWAEHLKGKRWAAGPRLPVYVYAAGVPLLIWGLLFSNNTREAFADLASGRAAHYDREVKKRRGQLEQCAREGRIRECPFEKIAEMPATTTNPYFEVDTECELRYWEVRAGKREVK